MDFKALLDTYSNKLESSERSNIFNNVAPNPPGLVSTLQEYITNYNSNDESSTVVSDDNISTTEPQSTESITNDTTIPSDLLDAISGLDDFSTNEENTIPETSESDSSSSDFISDIPEVDLTENNAEEDILGSMDLNAIENDFDEFSLEDSPTEENLENDNFLDNEENIESDDFNFEDSNTDDFSPNIDSDAPFNNEEDADLSDFLGLMDDEDSSPVDNDFNEDESYFSEEIADSGLMSDSSDDFDIEIPEEFDEAPISSEIEESSEEISLDELPDFTNTQTPSDIDIDIPTNNNELKTANYEVVDKSLDFNTWDSKKATTKIESSLDLTEDQIFKIRYKINSLKNKSLRFKIREIISDPESYPDIYDSLLALLLIDSDENTLLDLIKTSDEVGIVDNIPQLDTDTTPPSFLAYDALEYQEKISKFQNEIAYNLKKYAFYGTIALLCGVFAWLGVAQPMRVNGIFQKGLTAVRNNNFIEGEALFQQANHIAGKPVVEWYVRYADVYKEKNLITEAANKYSSALALDPKNIEVATHASEFYTELGPKYYTNALRIMNTLSGYYPKNFDVWSRLGELYVEYSEFFDDNKAKQTELLYDALDIYQKFIINNPKNVAPMYKVIDIYIRIGNRDQIDKIARLLDAFPNKIINLETMNNLGKYYLDVRNLDGATQVFKKIAPMLDQYVTNVPALQKRLSSLYSVNPNGISNIISDSYYEYARYKMLSSGFKEAGVLLTNSIVFNRSNDQSYNLLGEAYLRSAESLNVKLPKAKSLFEQSLELERQNYKAHINLGHLYYMWEQEMGGVQSSRNTALYHYKTAQSMIPSNVKNPLLNYNQGWLEFQNNNISEAIDLWSDIYQENPENPVLSFALGSALYQRGNPQLSQVILNKTVDSLENLKQKIPVVNTSNRRHVEIVNQLAKTYNNIGVINANYALANPARRDNFDAEALLNFYKAQNLSDELDNIYSTVEYNIGVISRPNVRNRKTIFDNSIPKSTSLESPTGQFNQSLLQSI